MDQSESRRHREPWNKGKLVGQKAPLRLKEIWAIRIRLQLAERLWHTYAAPHQSGTDLSQDKEPQSRAAFARALEARKHGALLGHRARRRPGDGRADGGVGAKPGGPPTARSLTGQKLTVVNTS